MIYTKSKYRAVKTTFNGIVFDSKKEAKRYQELLYLQKANIIKDLKLQQPFILIDKSKYGREIKYIADFVYFDNELNETVIEDTKGYRTDIYRLKKRLFQEKFNKNIKET